MIAPHFEGLATKYTKPNRIAFVKVNVDNQQAIAQQYGVRAMPTFLVIHNNSVINTIQGANPPSLTAAVEKAIKLAGAGGGSSFGTAGQRLGGAPLGGQRAGGSGSIARPVRWDLNNIINTVLMFFGLYFASLFSVSIPQSVKANKRAHRIANTTQLDPYKAAENSPYNKHNPPPKPAAAAKPGTKSAARPGFKTLSDLGNE